MHAQAQQLRMCSSHLAARQKPPNSLCCHHVNSWTKTYISPSVCSPHPALAVRTSSSNRLPYLLVSCVRDEWQARCVARKAGALRTRNTM